MAADHRYAILIPCMDSVRTGFMTSLLNLRRPQGSPVIVSESSLIYSARHMLGEYALESGCDRVLWLDSDMRFEPDLLERLSADIDDGRELVAALYVRRSLPVTPVIYSAVSYEKKDSEILTDAEIFRDYPRGRVFGIAGCGFGAVMMTTGLLRRVTAAFGAPFLPMGGLGEDLSFCWRAGRIGEKLWCDSRIRVGHIGLTDYVPEES